MKDSIGDRMKMNYESRARTKLPRRTNTIIRIDGKAFHTYTKGLDRPFDAGFVEDMNETAEYLCKNIQGAKCAFVQSDEISILLTDYDNLKSDAWFDGSVQKICSVSASMATATFNALRLIRDEDYIDKFGLFDSRVFIIPQIEEVVNYFIWRQQDTVRNSISSVAQSFYSHQDLDGRSTNAMQEMIFQKGVNWNDYDIGLKRGRLVMKVYYTVANSSGDVINRSEWTTFNAPEFTKDRETILKLI